MDVKLPLVVVHPARRLVEAWVPGLPGVHRVGPSLSEIRDDLCLAVMDLFEKSPVSSLARFQLPPHVTLRMVDVETVVQDKVSRRRWTLEGRLGVLLEKWPGEDFWVVTPTRIPKARFALRAPHDLTHALQHRLAAFALEHSIESLKPWSTDRRERLDVLDVDADPPSIFPKGWHRFHVPGRKRAEDPADKPKSAGEPSREERRRTRRFTVKTLREVGRNLAHGARDDSLDRAFGREPIVRALVDEFDLREGTAVVLVGAPGSGKTAIVHELVRRLVARQQNLGTRRDVWRVDGNRFIAGMMYVGQWEARARELLEELLDLGDILYVDDLASMVYAGRTRSGDTNVARFLEPHLARGELTVIAECTPERFERVREEEPTFASLFRVVHVDALDERATLPVLLGVLRDLESDTADGAPPFRVSPDAMESVLALTRRFLAHEAFPGKAVRLLRAVLSGPGETRDNVRWYTRDEVIGTFQRQTGLPGFVLGAGHAHSWDELRRMVSWSIVGQPEAVEAVADAVTALQTGLNDPEKPLVTYLFVGPTGVGKTETARALAQTLFGDASRLVRFDMSEFASAGAITRLVGHAGAPDGELTLALRTQPFCVVLFDEIEKAHPRVFDALLQLLGEGRLTDAAGRLADARQAVILMTSNLGVKEASARTGFVRNGDDARAHYIAAVRKFFRPEFFNRIDRVVPFGPLSPEALRAVVDHALVDLLSRRGLVRGNVVVDVDPELLDALVEQAYDPRYGARPIRRALERGIAVPLAHHMVRRRSTDRCLIDVYRGAQGLSLAVRSLRNAAPVHDVTDPAQWTAADVVRRLDDLRARLTALETSAAYDRLADDRARALRAIQRGGDVPLSPGLELLERMASLRDELARLEERDPRAERFVEEVSAPAKSVPHNHGRTPQHSVAPAVVRTYQTAAHDEVVLQQLGRPLADLFDDLEVLEHQVAHADTLDRVTVLAELLTGNHRSGDTYLLREALDALPGFLGRVEAWREHRSTAVDDDDATPVWSRGHEGEGRTTRYARSVQGVGARALLSHYAGVARYTDPASNGLWGTFLLRITVLDGDDVPAAVAAWDASKREALAARRRGEGDDDAVLTVALTGTTDSNAAVSAETVHVATGLPTARAAAICAAMIRSAAGAQGGV